MDVAAACRRLSTQARVGALATLARDPLDHPFATLVAIAADAGGQPLFVLSSLAEHTKNLQRDGRASLLLWHADSVANVAVDPLASERMTLVGVCAPVPTAEVPAARAMFLAAHPAGAAYASLGDFAVWRLAVAQARWIGGFGRMTWIDGDAYARGG